MSEPVPRRPPHPEYEAGPHSVAWFIGGLVIVVVIIGLITGFATAWWKGAHGHWAPQRNTPEYSCHTFATWDSRNYAAFTLTKDGSTIACWQVGPRWQGG